MRILAFVYFAFLSLFANSYELAKSYAEYYSKALPQRRDVNFTLTALLNVADELYYHYKINNSSSNFILKMSEDELKEYRDMLKKRSILRDCKDERVLAMLRGGMKLHHLFYRDRGAKLLFEFVLDKKDCGI